MTEQLDLDALIAEAREWPRDGVNEGPLINALADALEQSQAELRQERERADEAVSQRNRAYRQRDEEREGKEGNLRALNAAIESRDDWRARLSRAEEAIARIDGEVKNFEQSDNDALCEIERHLTEYDKQKEADRG